MNKLGTRNERDFDDATLYIYTARSKSGLLKSRLVSYDDAFATA